MENNCLPKLGLHYQTRRKSEIGSPRRRWREEDHLKAKELNRTGFTALNLQRS
jgi:hypothetical protein